MDVGPVHEQSKKASFSVDRESQPVDAVLTRKKRA
jgi:hypothetical protein